MRHDVSTPLNRACEWRIFVQRSVRSHVIIIVCIGLQDPPQVRLAQDNDMVHALATDRSDEPFSEGVLQRRLERWVSRMPIARIRRVAVAP